MSPKDVKEKTEVVEQLATEAWMRALSARDIVLLSEHNSEDIFTWEEKDGLEQLAADAARLVDRIRAKNGKL
jgi:hypothetical protein